MKKTVQKALTLLLTLAIMLSTVLVAVPASAATFDGNTDFMSGNYGMFIHYLAGKYVDAEVNTEEYSAQWNAAVNSFDVAAFANQARDLGVSWVTLTLTQADSYYPMPMPELNAFMDNGVDYGTERDLVNDLYAALETNGIKLMLYWIPGAPGSNEAVAEKLGAAEKYVDEKGNVGEYLLNDTIVNNMATIMSAVSERYGDKVAGWWIDGCYTTSANFTETYANIEAAALRAGNPDALVAFNNGTNDGDCRFAVENYTAGEICHVWKDTTIYDYTATGRWSDNGFQKHYLTFLGGNPDGATTDKGWGVPGTLYNTTELVNHVVNNMLLPGAALTLDVAVSATGAIDVDQANQISALKAAYNKALVNNSYSFASEAKFPMSFDDGTSALGWLDFVGPKSDGTTNVYGTTSLRSGDSIYLTSQKALNGEYSLAIVPGKGPVDMENYTDATGGVRTDVHLCNGKDPLWKQTLKMPGNPDFSKTDFTKVTGMMMRVKVSGATTESKTHKISFHIFQKGISTTFLSRGAVIYDKYGNKLNGNGIGGSDTGAIVPKNFDGFIFLPLDRARGDNTFAVGEWQDYNNSPDALADLSKEFTFAISLVDASFCGSTVYLDDIDYFSGSTDADAWNKMRALGYGVIKTTTQPTVHTLPITFDDGVEPTTGYMAIGNGTLGWSKYWNLPIRYVANDSKVLNGVGSMSIKTDVTSANNYAEGGSYAKINTNEFTVAGIPQLSTENIKAAASDKYAYLKIRIKVPTLADPLELYPIFVQNSKYWVASKNVIGYNVDGTKNAAVVQAASETGITIPSGFDGYIYVPVYSLAYSTFSDYGYKALDNVYKLDTFITEGATTPNLDQNFKVRFQFIGGGGTGELNNTEILMDDIDVIFGNLENDYEGAVTPYTVFGISSSFGTSSLVTGSEALNGNTSVKFTLNNPSDMLTEKVTLPGNPDYVEGEFDKVSGIMMRIKIDEASSESTAVHNFRLDFSQNGAGYTNLGRHAYAFDKNGKNGRTASGGWPNAAVAAGFDGFVFMPFSKMAGNNANYGQHEYDFVDFSKPFEFQIRFFGNTWAGCDVTIDDIYYYSGIHVDTADKVDSAAACDMMRELGYQIFENVEQPTVYTLPNDYENYYNPFNTTTACYSYVDNAGTKHYPTQNHNNALIGEDNALSGKVSSTIFADDFDYYEANGGTYVRAETNFATFKGNAALDKETLGKASSTYAYFTMKVKFPAGAGKYRFYLNLKQDGVAGFTTLKATFGYTKDGSRLNFTTSDLFCDVPAGFEGTLYFPISRALYNDGANGRGSYTSKPENMVDLTQDFQMQLYTYGAEWKNSEVLIDDLAYEFNVLGDIDGDGLFDVKDIISIKRHLLGKKTVSSNVADFNNDGIIDIRDLIRVKNMLAE